MWDHASEIQVSGMTVWEQCSGFEAEEENSVSPELMGEIGHSWILLVSWYVQTLNVLSILIVRSCQGNESLCNFTKMSVFPDYTTLK